MGEEEDPGEPYAFLAALSGLSTTLPSYFSIALPPVSIAATLPAALPVYRTPLPTSGRETAPPDDANNRTEWLARMERLDISRTETNQLVMDYLVTEGYKEAAERFSVEANIKPTRQLDSLDKRVAVKEAIEGGNIEEAVTLLNRLNPLLLDDDRQLYYKLLQLQLIELIRTGKVEEALNFAQSNLSEAGDHSPEFLVELERTLALLAFDNPESSPYGDLLAPSQRQLVASRINSALLEYECKPSQCKLAVLLKVAEWAQCALEDAKVKFPKMSEFSTAEIEETS